MQDTVTNFVHAAIGGLLLATTCNADAVDGGPTTSAILDRANSARATAGRRVLSADEALTVAAGEFARCVAKSGKFNHTADDRRPEARAAAAGYAYYIIAETIGYLYRSDDYPSAEKLADEFVKGWLASPGHRGNLLDATVTQTGIGVARDEAARYYAVQLFGLPRSAAIAFEIRNGASGPVTYHVDGQRFSLQPRASRRHEVCGPAKLSVPRPARAEPSVLQAENNARYTVLDDRIAQAPGTGPADVLPGNGSERRR